MLYNDSSQQQGWKQSKLSVSVLVNEMEAHRVINKIQTSSASPIVSLHHDCILFSHSPSAVQVHQLLSLHTGVTEVNVYKTHTDFLTLCPLLCASGKCEADYS